jgi:hypothetical protein
MKVFFLQIFFLALATIAQANEELKNKISIAQESCPTLQCVESDVQLIKLTKTQMRALPRALLLEFRNVAEQIANEIWPETELEDFYGKAGHVNLESIGEVYHGRTLIAYRVTYSLTAWGKNSHQLGKLVESAFISTDFLEIFRDEKDTAHFVAE